MSSAYGKKEAPTDQGAGSAGAIGDVRGRWSPRSGNQRSKSLKRPGVRPQVLGSGTYAGRFSQDADKEEAPVGRGRDRPARLATLDGRGRRKDGGEDLLGGLRRTQHFAAQLINLIDKHVVSAAGAREQA